MILYDLWQKYLIIGKNLKSSFWTFFGGHHDFVKRYGISVSRMTTCYVPFVVFVTGATWWVSIVEQELLILLKHLSSFIVLVRFVSLNLSFPCCNCLFFLHFYFDHGIVFSSVFVFWVPLLHIQFFLNGLLTIPLQRNAWRYQMYNQKPQIEENQKM